MNGVWILLGILKWVGIVLLGLLLLLFLILGVVMLSPIRYRFSGKKAEEIGGSFDVSYLFGAVRVNGSYTPAQAVQIKGKVLWLTLFGGDPKEEKKSKKKKKSNKNKKESTPKNGKAADPIPLSAAEKQAEQKKKEKPKQSKQTELPNLQKTEEKEQDQTEGNPKGQKKTVRRVKISEIQERPPADANTETEDLSEEEAFFTGEAAVEETEKTGRIPPVVKQVWGIQDKKAILKALQKLLKRLIKGILPGNLFLKGTIGTGDPTTTGYVLAAAGILTSKFGEDLQIKGDFTEKKAEDIEVRVNGKIVLGYLAWSVLAFAAAKPVRSAIWYMIKEARKKDGTIKR